MGPQSSFRPAKPLLPLQFVYCQVCCEPFHKFCLEESERPLEEQLENWCCRRCKFCHVCGRQHQATKVSAHPPGMWWASRTAPGAPLAPQPGWPRVLGAGKSRGSTSTAGRAPLSRCLLSASAGGDSQRRASVSRLRVPPRLQCLFLSLL